MKMKMKMKIKMKKALLFVLVSAEAFITEPPWTSPRAGSPAHCNQLVLANKVFGPL